MKLQDVFSHFRAEKSSGFYPVFATVNDFCGKIGQFLTKNLGFIGEIRCFLNPKNASQQLLRTCQKMN
jgi:hypothetical protein